MPKVTDPILSEDDVVLHEQIVPAFSDILGGEQLPEDPAELEQIAATLLVPLELPGVPAALSAALLAEIEHQADASAAALLHAIAVVAGEPLAAQARTAAQRLGDAGVVSPLAHRLGTLKLREAARIDGGDAELLVAQLRRPGTRRNQLALLGIDRGESGGALVSCMLTPPVGAAAARRMIEAIETHEGAGCPQPLAAEELTASVRSAAQRAVDLRVPLDAESAVALPLIARALTGDPLGLPRPQALAPWEDDDGELIVDAAEDEHGFRSVMAMLLAEFEEHATTVYPSMSAIWHSGDFVASTMLEWKGGYGDGCLGRWTAEDVAEFLLDHFPRKVSATQETLDAVVECAIAFLGFLDARGSLSGEPLEHLQEVCLSLNEPFLERVGDPAGWGLAKSMAMQMLTDGVDLDDPDALADWMEDFNARPREERDAIVGGAMDRMLDPASPAPRSGGSRPAKRRSQRKAQRAARKRNRG
ncbi:MAG: hypothetical protein QOJ63_1520 [Solirubrobacteraceae bacterium]|jgi:hypothetical protein|nr:hypothetical protein [Solirubrobacteraceae bacterium]